MPPTNPPNKGGQQPSVPYESKPSKWTTLATRDGDLGYHGFYPPRPGQDEEILSENTIKYGYTDPAVAGELWQGTDTFRGVYQQDGKNGLDSLSDIMQRVLNKRAELHAVVEENTFKLPSRVTLIGEKRTRFLQDLANEDVPLSTLAKAVPNTPKNHELLEMLFSNKIPADRAMWYIRVLGAIEIQARKTANSQSMTSVDWTNIITSYLKKQLIEIAMPTTFRLGSNIKQSFKKSKLSDQETRDGWVSRYAWTLELLHLFFKGDMLDQVTFFTWLSTVGDTPPMAPHQYIFIVRLADEYFDVVASNRQFAGPLLQGCLVRYSEVDASPVRHQATYIIDGISSFLLRLFCANPDFFMNRQVLTTYGSQVQDLLNNAMSRTDSGDAQNKFRERVRNRFDNLMDRGNAILKMDLPAEDSDSDIGKSLEDIERLNSTDITTNLSSFAFLPCPTSASAPGSASTSNNGGGGGNTFDSRLFTRRLFLLLSWATRPNQAGEYRVRPSVAATLIALWKTEASPSLPHVNQMLQRNLLAWLDENGFLQPRHHSPTATTSTSDSPPDSSLNASVSTGHESSESKAQTVEAAALLFGELTHRKLFGFNDYLNRMTSFGRGSTAKSEMTANSLNSSSSSNTPTIHGHNHGQDTEVAPCHLEILRCIPLWDKISEQALNQRKIVLYGIRAKKTVEDVLEKEIRAEIRRILPLFFNGPPNDEPLTRELLVKTLGASKFVQARVLHHWLMDLVKDYVNRTALAAVASGRPVLPPRVYNVLVRLFSWTGLFISIAELNDLILPYTSDDGVLASLLGTIRRHLDAWVCANRINGIVGKLLETNVRVKEQQRKSHKPLVLLLSEIAACCSISPEFTERIQHEALECRKILLPETYSSSPVQPLYPFILAAIKESSLDRPVDLATMLWYKNHTHADWGMVSWKATVSAAGSRSWDPSITDAQMAERFASLVQNLDCHLPDGIEKVVITWFETTGSEELMFVDDGTWILVKDTLLRLALNGVIMPQTILSGMVYPVWHRIVRAKTKVDALTSPLIRTMELVRCLLCHPTSCNGAAAVSAEQELEWETCRARCFRPGHLSPILDGLASLSVFEHEYVINEEARGFLERFRKEVAQGPSFRNEIPPRTNLVRSALAKATLEYPEHRAIFCNIIRRSVNWESLGRWSIESGEPIATAQWKDVLNHVGIWSFSKIYFSLQLVMEQLIGTYENSSENGAKVAANQSLENFAMALLEHYLSSSGKVLVIALLKDCDPLLNRQIISCGLRQLDAAFAGIPSDAPLDDILEVISTSQKLLKLVIIIRRAGATPSSAQPVQNDNECIQSWIKVLKSIQTFINTTRAEGSDQISHEVTNAICFMVRVLHLYVELRGPDLGSSSVDTISILFDLSLMFGGEFLLDDAAFELFMDTIFILMDDASKDAIQHLNRRFNEQWPLSSLPSRIPSSVYARLSAILPFVPQDKLGFHLARAEKVNGEYKLVSQLRSRAWEWMESIDQKEESSVLSSKVKNTAAMPLELFDVTSTGESVLPERFVEDINVQSGVDIWSFRENSVSEGVLGRAWRESRIAWDAMSLDGSDRVTGSSLRALSPTLSRSSAHMSGPSRKASPPTGNRPTSSRKTTGASDVVMVDASGLEKSLKRKKREGDDDSDDDVVFLGERSQAAGGTVHPQAKRGRGGKTKVKR